MPITVWGNANANVQDAPNDPNDDLNNGFQASCGGAANPEPLDFYLWQLGETVNQLEIDVAAAGGGGGGGTITTASNLGAADLFSGINGTALEFRGLTNADGFIDITQGGTDISIDLDEGALVSSATFANAVDARIDQELNSALFADGNFVVWDATNNRFEPATSTYDPSDTTQVGGVYTQYAVGTTSVLTLPAGGTWAYIITSVADSNSGTNQISVGGATVLGQHGNQTLGTRAGTAAGGTSFSITTSSFSGQNSIFAIRIA